MHAEAAFENILEASNLLETNMHASVKKWNIKASN